MSIVYLDPSAEPGVPVEPYLCRLSASDETPSIGLLANGYPDSVPFLGHLEAALKALLPRAGFHQYNKRNAGIVCPPDLMAKIKAENTALVAAWGH
ncbi:MAG: hypothetical protein U1E97_00645 [Alphaproteobacteria bacterium]|mgnify:CR=1 FL=1